MPSDGLPAPRLSDPLAVDSEARRRAIWAMRWGGLVAALLVLDYYRWKKNDRTTFSDSIRYVLHTDTEEGKAALRLLLDLFYRHLIN